MSNKTKKVKAYLAKMHINGGEFLEVPLAKFTKKELIKIIGLLSSYYEKKIKDIIDTIKKENEESCENNINDNSL